jgi:hypothetical protein
LSSVVSYTLRDTSVTLRQAVSTLARQRGTYNIKELEMNQA